MAKDARLRFYTSNTEDVLMLVLTRSVGQEIVIDDNIRLVVVSIDRNKVRLGVIAPPKVPVWRKELLDNNTLPPKRKVD
jgi:carbon storage regulator